MSLFISTKLLLLSAALLGVARSSALPAANLFSRQSTTPDGTCGIIESGSGRGYRCPTGSSKCCSQWGWCGDSTDHCGTGCQAAYGSCTGTGTGGGGGGGGGGGTTPPPTGGRPRPGSVPYGQIITSCAQNGVIALTFDDGPYIYTPGLLDILSRNGVHATFFINGQNWGDPITSSANQGVLQRMIADGHQIGSHTWAHPSLDSLSTADITSQMTQIETALVNIIGKYPTYMRPPYFECGSNCLSTMDALSYHVIYTNLDTLDWANTDNIQVSRDIFSNAVTNSNTASSNFIVLSHDVHPTTVNGLVQYMIDTLKAKGYRTVTIGECLNDPAANWYRT